MSLAESQQFFFELCADRQTMARLRRSRKATLAAFFTDPADREALATYPLERFQTYRNHVSIGVLGSLAGAFPLLRSLITEKDWNELLNAFYLQGHSRSPIARHVFHEFAKYLISYQGPLLDKVPCLHELADFESLDLKLFYAKDVTLDEEWAREAPDDPLALIPVLNPLLEIRHYHWPLHTLKKGNRNFLRQKPGTYPLIAFRHPSALDVHFVDGNRLFAGLIAQLQGKRRSIRTVLNNLARQFGISENGRTVFVQEGVATIAQLRQRGMILGMKYAKRRKR